MQLLKILIADDEEEARMLVIHFLNELPEKFEYRETADGQSTLNALKIFQPDILFLDVKMPVLTGIEVLMQKEQLPRLPAIIFTTASDEYAVTAFEFDVIDYLLKPFGKQRFYKAFKKAQKHIDATNEEKTKNHLSHISVKTGNKTVVVPLNEVDYFQADNEYVKFFARDKNFLHKATLYELEENLPDKFVRVHRSFIVNTESIAEIKSLLNGDYLLKLKTGREIRASRTYKGNFKKALKIK